MYREVEKQACDLISAIILLLTMQCSASLDNSFHSSLWNASTWLKLWLPMDPFHRGTGSKRTLSNEHTANYLTWKKSGHLRRLCFLEILDYFNNWAFGFLFLFLCCCFFSLYTLNLCSCTHILDTPITNKPSNSRPSPLTQRKPKPQA